MAPLLVPDGSLPLPLVHEMPQVLLGSSQPPVNSSVDLLTVVGTLVTDPNGRVWNEWSRSYALLTDPFCSSYPSERDVKRYLACAETLGILSAFFALSPPLQAENHVALIARVVPAVPAHEVRWKPIIDLAYVINFGLKAAMTRTGSKGHTLEPTPKWMREQLDTIHDIIANSSESTQLFADTSIASGLRSSVSTSHRMLSAVPSSLQDSFSSEDPVGDSGEQVRRDPDAVGDCLSRDSSLCVLTAVRIPVVAHIIPYSCGCMTDFFDTSYFWLLLQFWLGLATARTVWEYVGGEKINRLENLLSIGAHVHVMFGAGKLILEPPIRNEQNIQDSAVVLRIWALDPDILNDLYTRYTPLRSLDEALEVANNNIREKGPHELSSGEYITLLRSNQSPLPDCTLLAVFSGICRLRHLANAVSDLLRSCDSLSRDLNEDGTLTGDTINGSLLRFPGACPSHPSRQPEHSQPSESSPSQKPKKRKRDIMHSSNNHPATPTRATPDNRGPETPPEFSQCQPDSPHKAAKRASHSIITHASQAHACHLHQELSAIAREQHEGGVVMLGFQRWQRERDREAEERMARRTRGETSLWDLEDSDDEDGMALFPDPEELRFLFPDS